MSSDRLAILERYVVASKHAALDIYYRSLGTRVLRCIVCDTADSTDRMRTSRTVCRFGGGELVRHHCRTCGALFGPEKMLVMSEAELSSEYEILYASYQEGDTVEDTARTFYAIEPVRGDVYLDWGCGWWSSSLAQLRSEGWNVWGYEPTPGGSSEFILNDLGHVAPGLSGIYSNNTIEHFIHPVDEFRKMRALLQPGARMSHSSPCYEERYLDTRFHTVFYLENSIDIVAERAGFRILAKERDREYINTVFEAV
ncbi:methyltransferase domain-containing protein [Brevundimonas sp. C43]|uniref:methyltransferase domain-containing protein n=1 Tax=Brevundimonas sp. C43 TaxID=3068314 RepID=UPI00273E8F29|nr:methyltransferase domain-containing protein [Brevundimonas sp. C43]